MPNTPALMAPPIEFTIGNRRFQIPKRYAPGHRLTPGEAQQLNSLYAKRVRNNVDEWEGEVNELQARIWAYAEEFEFTPFDDQRGCKPTPFEQVLWALAEEKAKQLWPDSDPDQITGLVADLLSDPELRAEAQLTVETEQRIAQEALEQLLGS